MVLDFESKHVVCTLKGHIGRVNAVITLLGRGGQGQGPTTAPLEIVSADDTGAIKLWRCSDGDLTSMHEATQNIIPSTLQTILSLEARYVPTTDTDAGRSGDCATDNLVITATDVNGQCQLWCRKGGGGGGGGFYLLDEFILARPQLARALHLLPLQNNASFIVAYGCVDSRIYLRLFTYSGSRFLHLYYSYHCLAIYIHM